MYDSEGFPLVGWRGLYVRALEQLPNNRDAFGVTCPRVKRCRNYRTNPGGRQNMP